MKKRVLKQIGSGLIVSFFVLLAIGSASNSDKPNPCDCVELIFEGPDMNTSSFTSEDDYKMAAEKRGWSSDKMDKWRKCRNAYPGRATVLLECDKRKQNIEP